jgi:hypothetical protein
MVVSERKSKMFSEFVAIDPLALIFPTSVYLILVEKLHPHEPVTAHLGEVVKQMNAEQRASVQARIRTLNAYTGAVEKALGQAAGAKA